MALSWAPRLASISLPWPWRQCPPHQLSQMVQNSPQSHNSHAGVHQRGGSCPRRVMLLKLGPSLPHPPSLESLLKQQMTAPLFGGTGKRNKVTFLQLLKKFPWFKYSHYWLVCNMKQSIFRSFHPGHNWNNFAILKLCDEVSPHVVQLHQSTIRCPLPGLFSTP